MKFPITAIAASFAGRLSAPLPRLLAWMGPIVMAGTMGACTMGPDYTRPDVSAALPEDFKVPDGWKVAEPGDDAPRGEWWKVFGDAQLNRLMTQAEEANQDLRAAFHRVEQARAAVGITRSAKLPQITFDPVAERTRRSGTISNSAPNVTGRTTTNLDLPLILDYEVDLWGRVRRSIEAAREEAAGAEADYHNVMLALQAELAVNYFNLRALDAEIEIFESAVDLRRQSLDLNQKRFEAGDVDEVDVSRAETELAATESELIGLRKSRAEYENAIAVLTGQPSSDFRIASTPLLSNPPQTPAGVPSSLLERRPDVAAAERQVAAENARIGVAKAAFFPSVRLTGNVGLESGSVGDLFRWESRTWGLGPEVTMPIFQGARNQAELARVESRYDEAVAQYRQAVLEAVREVDDALVGVSYLAGQAAAQDRTVASARRTVELSRKRYDAGLVAYFDVVDSQRTQLDSEQVAVRIRAERYLSTIALIKALGGGW